jgi:hypothetical protein
MPLSKSVVVGSNPTTRAKWFPKYRFCFGYYIYNKQYSMATKKWKEENIDKMREYRNEWYERNKQAEREKAKIRQAERRKEFKEWYREYKSNLKCSKCGFSHPAALDFHHIDSSKKEFTLGSTGLSVSKDRFLKEIEKCVVLCANCHRIHHYEENNGSLV